MVMVDDDDGCNEGSFLANTRLADGISLGTVAVGSDDKFSSRTFTVHQDEFDEGHG